MTIKGEKLIEETAEALKEAFVRNLRMVMLKRQKAETR